MAGRHIWNISRASLEFQFFFCCLTGNVIIETAKLKSESTSIDVGRSVCLHRCCLDFNSISLEGGRNRRTHASTPSKSHMQTYNAMNVCKMLEIPIISSNSIKVPRYLHFCRSLDSYTFFHSPYFQILVNIFGYPHVKLSMKSFTLFFPIFFRFAVGRRHITLCLTTKKHLLIHHSMASNDGNSIKLGRLFYFECESFPKCIAMAKCVCYTNPLCYAAMDDEFDEGTTTTHTTSG